MLKRLIAIVFGVAAVAVLNAIVSQPPSGKIADANLTSPVETVSPRETDPSCVRPKKEVSAGDAIQTFARLTHGDYLIQTRYKMATLDVPPEYQPPPKPVKVSYVIVKHNGTVIRKFDAEIYTPLGNSTRAGFFSLLGKGSDQLIISQDLPKTGVQWVADFSKGFKIIFDGQKFLVGRESYDMTMSDLDGDGIAEITVPITAFYGFEGWRLYTGDTPLPDIVFKYDPRQREYLPANPLFKECLLKDIGAAEKYARSVNQQTNLGRLMAVVLDYAFAGEEQRGWKFFEDTCTLRDKARIKEDMQKELNEHPVYRYIYKQRANR